jgi:hypothetical protein
VEDRPLTGRSIPTRATELATVPAGSEAVLLEESRAYFHMLDVWATLVWECVDGEATLGEIAKDIAEATSAPYERVLADVLALVTDLRRRGLVVDGPMPRTAMQTPRTDPERPGELILECAVLGRTDGTCVLVDDRAAVEALDEGAFDRQGLHRRDASGARLDRSTLRLLPVGERVSVIVLLGSPPDHLKVSSPARRLGSLVPFVTRSDGSASARDLADVFRLAESIPVVRALGFTPDQVEATLGALPSETTPS